LSWCKVYSQKDRIEKLITNILNEEGYSKLQQFVKENVKAALSENKQVLSVALTALLQALKSDPKMAKLILNIPSTNDGGQHRDNDNNIVKYLELNKDRILNLAERNYENLVKTLTNNVMNTAANSTYNPTLSLPQSSSMFSNLSTQSDTYRIEKS
jgi:F0F1-type ATP synthase gamma subunit